MRADLLLAAALSALMGCDDGVRRLDPTTCDPRADTGCAPGTHCRLLGAGELACLAQRAAPQQGTCVPGSCAPSYACVEVEGALGCHKVCALGADDCAAPSQCAYRVSADGPLGVCSPACSLGDTCPDNQSCATTARLDHLVCAAVGPRQAGDPCDADARCGGGLACLVDVDGSPRCRTLCAPDDDRCPAGACLGRIRQVGGVGFCTGT